MMPSGLLGKLRPYLDGSVHVQRTMPDAGVCQLPQLLQPNVIRMRSPSLSCCDPCGAMLTTPAGAQDGVVKYWDLRRFMASTQSLAVDLFDSEDPPDTAKQVRSHVSAKTEWMQALRMLRPCHEGLAKLQPDDNLVKQALCCCCCCALQYPEGSVHRSV